jgi:hypothetical protein
MILSHKVEQEEVLLLQVDRILRSDEFRSSEVLRRLLTYLADKAVSGEADQLKEYVIAIDGLGKPSSYDPQHNSAVRIQVGRLRQKLTEYYRTEGKDDEVLIYLPKGRFRLVCEQRSQDLPQISEATVPPQTTWEGTTNQEEPLKRIRPSRLLGTFASLLLFTICVFTAAKFWYAKDPSTPNGMTPELVKLWAPFIESNRPLIISIEDPLFAEVRSNPGIYFRDRSMNQWKDVANSPAIKTLTGTLKQTDIQPSRYYTAFGEVEASFMLGKLLGSHEQNFQLVRTSQLSWERLADNNVVFVGVQNLFFDQLSGMPIKPQLLPSLDGIHDTNPVSGGPALYADQYSTAPSEQGMMYALVTHLAGPVGHNDIESFTSVRSAGYVAAVQWFTDPGFARTIVSKLEASNGSKMPRYYQILLRVKFKDNVPTETSYVLGRVLQ